MQILRWIASRRRKGKILIILEEGTGSKKEQRPHLVRNSRQHRTILVQLPCIYLKMKSFVGTQQSEKALIESPKFFDRESSLLDTSRRCV